jgi:hypothetical protein
MLRVDTNYYVRAHAQARAPNGFSPNTLSTLSAFDINGFYPER